jgi:cytochrome P450
MKLPRNLVNLNRSLHSMRGAEHSTQKRLLIGLLNNVEPLHQAVWGALEEETAKWTLEPVELVKQMREIVLRASFRVLFGDGYEETWQLASLLQTYFHLRREATSPGSIANREAVEDLVSVGNLLDSRLRSFIRKCENSVAHSGGVLANLANDARLTEDEIVGHMNVFFISATEPVAIALSWVLLVLSQLPELRIELQNELAVTLNGNRCPTADQVHRLVLLDGVVNETLRMLPPNALMVRITTKPAQLNEVLLPSRCEVVLSPFISHRDETAFYRPDEFLPSRWRGAAASPFLYFPFGAGGHSCIGRSIAMDMIKATLAFMLPRFDVLLAESQEVDWSIRIQFMPSPDPSVVFHPRDSASLRQSGALTGPLARLLNLGKVGMATT